LLKRTLATAAERARAARSAGSVAGRVVSNPAALGDTVDELRRVGSALSAIGVPAPQTLLNRPIGPRRSVAFAELSLEAAKEIGRPHGATVNDVVLATAALALGRYLRRGGECHPWLRVLVPVSTRADHAGPELGNRLSAVFVELPTGERDPRAVLAEVSRQSRELKQGASAQAIDGVMQAASLVPTQVRDALAWLMTRPQTFNTVVSNLPGSGEPLYLLGRRVQSAYPAVPLVRCQGLSIGMLSYCGVLHVGLYACPSVVGDVLDVAHDIASAFDSLRVALTPGPRRPDGSWGRRPAVVVPG
jgi:WS/DGAT/MGAT family acyltransferase